MEEVAKVIKAEGERAVIRIDKKGECEKCGMCLFPKNASHVDVIAVNKIGAKEEDVVVFSPAERSKSLAIILVFLVPLLLIGLSTGITYLFIGIEIFVLILSVGLIAVWFFILSIIDKKLLKTGKFSPEIKSVIKAKENDDN